jgi:hypothetical protein
MATSQYPFEKNFLQWNFFCQHLRSISRQKDCRRLS